MVSTKSADVSKNKINVFQLENSILSLLCIRTLQITILVPEFRMGKNLANYVILKNVRKKHQISGHRKLPKNDQIPQNFWH